MPFDLTVATKRDPRDSRSGSDAAPPVLCATIGLSGMLSSRSTEAVMATISQLDGDGSKSIIVEVNEMRVEDERSIRAFARGIMSFRERGCHLQVSVMRDDLYERMAALPDARDWLISRDTSDLSSPRKAIHVDPPTP